MGDRETRGNTKISHLTPGIFDFITHDSTCLDLGANIGDVTAALRARGAEVWAFEPHPAAVKTLINRFAADAKAHIIPAGVGIRDGRQRLYFHKDSDACEAESGAYSSSASFMRGKRNVSEDNFTEVEVVRLSDYVRDNFPTGVDFVKMDIEGLEADLIGDLIDSGQINKIKRMFVETHEGKVRGLWFKLLFIKLRLFLSGQRQVRFDWV